MEKLIKTKKERKGITLVSLVITIIVLLILAGITINLIIGEDGIIRRAQEAGKNYIDAAENEKLQLGVFSNEMENIIGGSINTEKIPNGVEYKDYELVVSDKNIKQTSLTSTVPEGVTEGIFVGVVSSGSTFKDIPTVTGNGIATSETIFELNQTGGAGVMLGIKVLKCTFVPNGTITTGGDTIYASSASIVNLILGK